MIVRSWIREPLVHFLLAGAVIFAITSLWPAGDDERKITIDRQQLFAYMRARASVTDQQQFDAMYANMPTEERRALIHRVALDEALYREGKAISLDQVDAIIHQRIIQQMRLLIGDEAAAGIKLTEAQLQAWYQAHLEDYRQGGTRSFSHVFFRAGDDAQGALLRANDELARLRAGKIPPDKAAAHGERFAYEIRYRDAGQDEVTAQFGPEFAVSLFALETGQWLGPLRSEHGWHLVYVSSQQPGGVPTSQQLGPRLREDALSALHEQAANAALEKMLGEYRIVMAPDLPQ